MIIQDVAQVPSRANISELNNTACVAVIPNDSSELNNLEKQHPQIVVKLSARLLKWQAELP